MIRPGSDARVTPMIRGPDCASIINRMAATAYQDIKKSLRQFYLEDNRPWLVGFSGGKDSAMLASLVFDTALSLPPAERTKSISVVCTDTRVEIPAIVEMVEGTLRQMQRCSQQNDLKELNQVRKLEEEFAGDNALTPKRSAAYSPSGGIQRKLTVSTKHERR